jgi:hypothetical protein
MVKSQRSEVTYVHLLRGRYAGWHEVSKENWLKVMRDAGVQQVPTTGQFDRNGVCGVRVDPAEFDPDGYHHDPRLRDAIKGALE